MLPKLWSQHSMRGKLTGVNGLLGQRFTFNVEVSSFLCSSKAVKSVIRESRARRFKDAGVRFIERLV